MTGLSAMDRHVIANMGAELGATTSIFPSDAETRRFLRSEKREDDWRALHADPGAGYDREEEIDLSRLEPLIAQPSSPGNVVPVREVAGAEIHQAYIGSSANPGFRDFAVAAHLVRGRQVHPRVSFDVNPTSRQLLESLVREGVLAELVRAGARIHQAGCNGCIGMGQAPATGRNSLRTVPRNFPSRSGTREDRVFLCSPETAAASALEGRITDPRDLARDLGIPNSGAFEPREQTVNPEMLVPPLPAEEARRVALARGPNIASLPEMDALPGELELPVLLRLGDDVSTDEILPAGARVLPYRSNIPKIAEFAFEDIDGSYVERAREARRGHAIIAGENYGQGSSREHAALAPRTLGLRLVLARSFARIHRQNLINFGVLPLRFAEPDEGRAIEVGDVLLLEGLKEDALRAGEKLEVRRMGEEGDGEGVIRVRHDLSERELAVVRAGGLVNRARAVSRPPC